MNQPISLSISVLWQMISKMKESVLLTTGQLDLPGPHIIYANESFCRMTGYTLEELIGKTPRILQGEKTDRSVMNRLKKDLKEKSSFNDGYAINYKKDGTEYYLEWDIIPIEGLDGKNSYFMAIQRDVTEIIKAKNDINELNSKLKEILER